MKFLLISTPSEDNLDSSKILNYFEKGLRKIINCEIKKIPLELSGKKVIKSLTENQGFENYFCRASNSLGNIIGSNYAFKEDLAIIEVESIIGQNLLIDCKNPLLETSKGVGEVILDSLNRHAKKIILWLDNTSSIDCGMGLAKFLGIKFLDIYGNEIEEGAKKLIFLEDIDISSIDLKLKEVCFEVVNINNDIAEEQKITKEVICKNINSSDLRLFLENSIKHFIDIIEKKSNKKISNLKGIINAGGLAMPLLAFFNATLKPSIEAMLNLYDFENNIKDTNFVIIIENSSKKYLNISSVLVDLIKNKEIPILLLYNMVNGNINKNIKNNVNWYVPFYYSEKYSEQMYDFFYEQAIYLSSLLPVQSSKN